MRPTFKIISVGVVWGCIEPIALFLSAPLFGIGQVGHIFQIYPPDLIAGGLGIPISFVSGIITDDLEDIMKALTLASTIALFSVLGALFLLPPTLYASREQNYMAAVYLGFLFLSPLIFFAGLLGGVAGVMFGGLISMAFQKRRDETATEKD